MNGIALSNDGAGEFDLSAAVQPSVGEDIPKRFTLDGNEALEAHLEQTCARITSGIRGLIPHQRLEAILLGGGYGRGEGGVLRGAEGDKPYNDLEFYIAIRGNRHLNEVRYHRRLEVLAEILTHVAGVEVEFKVTSLDEIAAKPISMFSYDLASGHRLLWSRDGADLEPLWERHRRSDDIPLAEATRLLMNRCSGLLLAKAELEAPVLTPKAADFVQRNIAKAQLACGDALLVAHRQYHWSCQERHRRLNALAQSGRSSVFEAPLRHHAAGVDFKLHPHPSRKTREELLALHRAVSALARDTWLGTESLRLGKPYASVRAYVSDDCDKCPGSPGPLNILLNLRADGMQGRRQHSPWRHPRGRVYHSLALLLWEPENPSDPYRRQRLADELGSQSEKGWLEAYRSLWARVR